MKRETTGGSRQPQLPGAQPQTLAELSRTSDRLPAPIAVATAELLRPKAHARLVLKGQEENSAENVLLRGLHYLDIAAANLHEKTFHPDGSAREVNAGNIQEFINSVKPYMEVIMELQEGAGILSSLIVHNRGEHELHSVQEAKALFGGNAADTPEKAAAAFDKTYGEETPFGQFVAGYDFTADGVRASSLMVAFLERSFGARKNLLSYEEQPVQEVVFDFLGTGSMIQRLAEGKETELERLQIDSANDPLGLDETSKRKRTAQAYSLATHEWKTPITSLRVTVQLAERRLAPPPGRIPDVEGAVRTMSNFPAFITKLEGIRHSMYAALQEGFVPTEIPLSKLVAETGTQLISWLGERVTFKNGNFATDGMVTISPSVWSGIINNAWQNAVRSRQALLIKEKRMRAKKAWKRALQEVEMECSVIVNERQDTVRILLTDNGRGITKGRRTHRLAEGDHGFDAKGVESNGIAMNQYASYVREAGGDLYLLQTRRSQPGIGATLIAKLPLHMNAEVATE